MKISVVSYARIGCPEYPNAFEYWIELSSWIYVVFFICNISLNIGTEFTIDIVQLIFELHAIRTDFYIIAERIVSKKSKK